MAGLSHFAEALSGSLSWRAGLLVILLGLPGRVLPVTVSGDMPDMLQQGSGLSAADRASTQRPARPPVPVNALSLTGLKNPDIAQLPMRNADLSANNRLLLFFLLLMAGVFGLLVEIVTSRRQD